MNAGDEHELGDRLQRQAGWLTYLMSHLAGTSIRRRLDLSDLVQEVFLRALSAAAHVPPERAGEPVLRRFLALQARRVVLDAARALRSARRSGREVALVRSDFSHSGVRLDDVALAATGAATAAAVKESRSRLLAGFESLSAEHRRVIGCRQFEGLSAAETARRMGRSETAIHSLYRRALQTWDERVGEVDR